MGSLFIVSDASVSFTSASLRVNEFSDDEKTDDGDRKIGDVVDEDVDWLFASSACSSFSLKFDERLKELSTSEIEEPSFSTVNSSVMTIGVGITVVVVVIIPSRCIKFVGTVENLTVDVRCTFSPIFMLEFSMLSFSDLLVSVRGIENPSGLTIICDFGGLLSFQSSITRTIIKSL